jgi:flagellar motor switch protein FliN/FliY
VSADERPKLETVENARQLLDRWTESLTQVLESMTDQKPQIAWRMVEAAPAELGGGTPDYLWWEQPMHAGEGTTVWVGAPVTVWEYAGTLTLKAAGLETVAASEAKNTWLEILGQSLSVLARAMGAVLGREVTCEAGAERAPADGLEWASVSIAFPEQSLPPVSLAFSHPLVALLASPIQEDAQQVEERHAETAGDPGEHITLRSRTIDLLLDVDLPVSISFGKARLPMRDVLKLTTGSIVELDRSVNDLVEVLVNHRLVARGEVVVVEGNYGVKIQEIASRHDRLRSIP